MCKLAPSILSADFACLGEQIKIVESAGVDILHIDVMDGVFVPNITIGFPVISSIRKKTSLFFDVHLMISEPVRYVQRFAEAGADMITVHIEACENLSATIQEIRDAGVRAGIAISPDTPLEGVIPYLDSVDMILIMSVYPGFGAQKILPDAMDRLSQMHTVIQERSLPVKLEVDGGVHMGNVKEIADCGVDIIVAGSSVFNGDIAANAKAFQEILESTGKGNLF